MLESVPMRPTYASSEDSNQPAHPRSLSRVFVVRMKNFASLASQDTRSDYFDKTERKRMLIWMFAGRTSGYVFWRWGLFVNSISEMTNHAFWCKTDQNRIKSKEAADAYIF